MEEEIFEKHILSCNSRVQRKANSSVPKLPPSFLLPDSWTNILVTVISCLEHVSKPVSSDLFSVLLIFSFSKLAQSHCFFLVPNNSNDLHEST